MEKKWRPNILLVADEAGLFPALVWNMLLYRSMRARQNAYHLQPEDYGSLRTGGLFGHMPIVVIAGDFLQIKPAADISIAEDYEALQKAGRKIHDEHDVAQRATLNIPDVIHLRKTKRFLDDDMPALMQAIARCNRHARVAHLS